MLNHKPLSKVFDLFRRFAPGAGFVRGYQLAGTRLTKTARLIAEGKEIFRFDTFGDEDFWGGQLRLHEAIQGEAFGGVGPGVSPATALEVGLKVDVKALPQSLAKSVAERTSRSE